LPDIPPPAKPAASEPPPDDPITTRPLAPLILISMFVLMLTVSWSLYNEFFGLRPWRDYQARFISAYVPFLERQEKARAAQEKALYATPDYQRLKAAVDAAAASVGPTDAQLTIDVDLLDQQRAAMTPAFQTARGLVGSLTYQLEQISDSDKDSKASKLKELNDAKAKTFEVDWPVSATQIEKRNLNYAQLNQTFTDLIAAKAEKIAARGDADQAVKDAQTALNEYVKTKLPGLGSADLEGLVNGVSSMDIKLRQINVNPTGTQIDYLGGVGLVDRCQSCHMGVDPLIVPATMTLTKADLGLANDHDAPFTSHPDPDLLKYHPLEKFGCSPCHGGNGRALDTVDKAHGRYEHWLWPLYYPENSEAGCQQCHASDIVTEHGPNITRARELYRIKGCIGCHRYQGFDNQDEQLVQTRQQIVQLAADKEADQLQIGLLNKAGDAASDNDTANRLYQQATNLTVTVSRMDAQAEQLEDLSHNLQQDVKKVGPDLKEVRMKLRPEWIPYWLGHTHEFRPTTKMPQFRLQQDEIEAIAAFIWQQGVEGPALPTQAPGDPAKGKIDLESRGCLACHSIGEGSQLIGGDFAANLSRVGEKENYDYLVRWIHNPRDRTRPYDPFLKRDLGPEDYAKKGLPFVFDLDHSRSPVDGHELVVEQPTIMPSLRLSWDESRDIASYLMTQKHADASYPAAPFIDDPSLKAKGEELVKHYGCAGCHEISGLEDEGRIGTELTNEGSKPIERLDFALFTEDAKEGVLPTGKDSPRGAWYDLKGFFEQKLSDPGIFDRGKYKPDPMDRLRMPKPNLTPADVNMLTTMLLGSVDPALPPEYMYKPSDQRAAIQKGWWLVTKYNCIGCHQIDVGQSSVLMGLPQYQGEDKSLLPPVLTTEGARVNPEWLRGFLANPSLSDTDTDRDGVRSYLQVRMPTFYLSDDEIRTLVLFFEALSSQQQPFIPQRLEPLTTAEVQMARDLFTSTAAPCLKCHMTGNPAHDKTATAPDFLLAKDRLRPAWTERWITNPALIAPGTAMPSGLFHQDAEGRWVFSGPLPANMQNYEGDNADLLVRYMFELTPAEEHALLGRTPSGGGSGGGAGK
jgi:cytochrome c551/c552